MNKFLPPSSKKHSHFKTYLDMRVAGHAVIGARPEDYGRPYGTRKLNIVCKECNNGWMSELQNEAIPILTPLMLGECSGIDQQGIPSLLNWALMTTIVNEFTDPPTSGIPTGERYRFHSNKSASPHWGVWIGDYVGNYRYSHWGSRFSHPHKPTEIIGTSQGTTATYGNLLVHTFYSTEVEQVEHYQKIMATVPQLVCISEKEQLGNGQLTGWPPLLKIDEEFAKWIAYDYYYNYLLPSNKAAQPFLPKLTTTEIEEVMRSVEQLAQRKTV